MLTTAAYVRMPDPLRCMLLLSDWRLAIAAPALALSGMLLCLVVEGAVAASLLRPLILLGWCSGAIGALNLLSYAGELLHRQLLRRAEAALAA